MSSPPSPLGSPARRARLGLIALLLCALPAGSHEPPSGGTKPHHLPRRGTLARGMRLVSQLRTTVPVSTPGYVGPTSAPGVAVGFNGDVWVHRATSGPKAGRTYAYVGSWGARRVTDETNSCPGSAIKIVDITDPSHPVQVAEAAVHADTTSEDVEVRRVTTALGEMDLLITGLQRCRNGGLAGADLWDVSDPTAPVRIGFYDVDVPSCFDNGDPSRPAVRGVHEIHMFQKGARLYALLPAIYRESTLHGVHPPAERCGPEVLLIDITDPSAPLLVDDWGALQDLGLDPANGLFDRKKNAGDFSRLFAHSTNTNSDHTLAYISYQDLGAILFDLRGLSQDALVPTAGFDLEANRLGRTTFPEGDEGNTHSAQPVTIGGVPLLLTTDEDFVGPPWGWLRVFDVSDPGSPVEIGAYETPHTRGRSLEVGDFTAHVPVVNAADPTKVVVSWYTDGVRLLDISNPRRPVEEGYLIPPPAADPFGIFADNTSIWGATFATIGGREYVVASDINFGLYLMERAP